MKIFRLLMLLGIAAACAPLMGVFLAGAVADAHGCRLHEGFANPCVIWGADRGVLLYNLAVGGWLMIFTLPLGAFLVVLWLVVEVMRPLVRWGRRQRM